MLKVYLSSAFSAFDDGASSLLALRADLKTRGARLGVEIVLGEEDQDILAAARAGDEPGVLEGCARLIGGCDAFFGMAFERHGAGITLDADPFVVRSRVSIFETELLAACFRRMPSRVVHIREIAPGQALHEFLSIVGDTLGRELVEVSARDLGEAFDGFVQEVLIGHNQTAPWIVDPLALSRIWRGRRHESKEPRLGFLGNAFRNDGAGDVDESVLRLALANAVRRTDVDGREIGQMTRLSHLWLAVRELSRATQDQRLHDLNGALQTAMDEWNNAAAWHGLHGAHPMGCLAALRELSLARAVKREPEPLIPRASAYYSVAGLASRKDAKLRFYGQSLDLCDRAARERGADEAAIWLQRASVRARLASLDATQAARYFDAIDDYKAAWTLLQRRRAPASSTAMAMTEYAFALARQPWKRRRALSLMQDGVAMFRGEGGPLANGFFIRALRKYSEMLASLMRLDEAETVAEEARALAVEIDAHDQRRQIDELVDRIKKKRRP